MRREWIAMLVGFVLWLVLLLGFVIALETRP
jgi:ABC-type transport system involved in multi-copper enzyme maturation permease subunit